MNLENKNKHKKQADIIFQKYIKYRDGQKFLNNNGKEVWYCRCLRCNEWHPFDESEVSYFIERKYLITRWDEFNLNAVCKSCYKNNNKKELGLLIDNKYGKDTANNLLRLSQRQSSIDDIQIKKIIKITKQDIQDLFL